MASAESARRSGCPISISLEIFGDRWSLLVVRDLMFKGRRTFREFAAAGEGIATNILADRLGRLEAAEIIGRAPDPEDGRRVVYRLTRKGMELAPVLMEMVLWAARHEDTDAPAASVRAMQDRASFLDGLWTQWRGAAPPRRQKPGRRRAPTAHDTSRRTRQKMAFDEALAARVRRALAQRADIEEKRMFGGVAFLLRGNMYVGVHGNDLIVRLDPDAAERALSEPGVRRFDITGRPMKGWLLVSADGLAGPRGLRRWLDAGGAFVASLPAKG